VEIDEAIANEVHDKAMLDLEAGRIEDARKRLVSCFSFIFSVYII
jgi:hypothetical protein